MAITLKQSIRNIRFRFVNSQTGEFLRWWAEALRDAMPANLRARLQYARRRLLIQVFDEEIALSIDDAGSIQSLDTFSTDQDARLQNQSVRELFQRHELTEVNRDLLLSEVVVLRTQVVMPLAAEANLRQALAYEMDRYTPYQSEEVFYNWRNLHRDRDTGQLHFELCVTPKEAVEAPIELLKRLGLSATGVDVSTPEGPLGINLLPAPLRYHIVKQ